MPEFTTGTGLRGPAASAQGASRTAGRHWWDAVLADRLTAIFGLWLAVALIYWPSAVALNAIWRGASGNAYTHGYLVLAASLWLLVRDRKRLNAVPVHPVGWAWVPVVILSTAWLMSWRAAIQTLHILLVPAILLTAVLAAMGWRIARKCLFPVGLLLFAIPIWDPINHGLQTASARLTEVLVWLSGMPVYVQADLIHLPGGTIEIAQACAGLNGVVIGLTVAALYGEIMRDPLWRRLLWLALMGTLALVANGVRIFIVTVAAYETDMRSPLVTHHIWLGWVLFAVAVGAFLALAGRLGNMWDPGRPANVWQPAAEQAEMPRSPTGVWVGRLTVALACLGLLPALSYAMDLVRSQTPSILLIQWPEMPQGWRGPMLDRVTEWSPRFENATAKSLRLYVDPGAGLIEAFAVAYRTQTQDGKLLGYRNDVLGKALRARSQRIANSSVGRWRETVAVDSTGARSLIWWRYRIGNRVFIDPRLSQVWYGLLAATGSPPLSSLTALRASCSVDCDAAHEELAAAASHLQPVLSLRMGVD